MSKQFEELSKPVQIFKHPSGRNFWSLMADSNAGQRDVEPFYSQEYVTALLAENAELKASLSEWEDCKHDGATYHDMSGHERCGRCGADL